MKNIIELLFRNTGIFLTSGAMCLIAGYLSSILNLEAIVKTFFVFTVILLVIAGGIVIYNAFHIGRCPECGKFVPDKNRVEDCSCRIIVHEWIPTWTEVVRLKEE